MRKRYFVILLILILFGVSSCKRGDVGDTADTGSTDISITPSISQVSEQDFSFTKADYFYREDTQVEIHSGKPGKIYYTTDGSDPNEEQALYSEPIKLIANNDTKATVIKAKVYYNDGTESNTLVHTYFVGKNVNERFDTLIFSVTTDPYNLYDYEYGIFVEGKLRDDYIAQNPGVQPNPDDPANYNIRGMEGEREVYLEVFEADGTRVIAQNAGIRTYGGWSRAREQKSFKIFARKEYDQQNNKLRYEFFPDRTSSVGEVIDSFKQLVLRNCGNDNGFTFIRDELFQTLAGQAGYLDHEAVRPAAVFVDGEYRGFYWLHEVYCDEYFEDHYGDYDGSFQVLEGGELNKNPDSDGENTENVKEYDDMYQTYSRTDLTNDDNFKKLSALIDVENYLDYFALNIYLNNEDWPHNNYKTYRYYTGEGENYGEAPFDGKWRYLLHDMDFSTGIYGKEATDNNISKYIGKNGEIMEICPLFGQLMKREDCREIFLKKTLDLINGVFEPTYFASVLDQMNASRLNELEHTYGMDLLEDWVSEDQLSGRMMDLKNYILLRNQNILTQYQEHFNLEDIYTLSVEPSDGCQIKINSNTADTAFQGSYYSDINTTVTATVPKGKKFDYWLVNGDKVKGKELLITPEMISENRVEVKMVTK